MDRINDEEIENFKNLCYEKSVDYYDDQLDERKIYNFYDIQMQIDKINSAIKDEETKLYKQIDFLIKENFSS